MAVALSAVNGSYFNCVRVTYHPTYSEPNSCRVAWATVVGLYADDQVDSLYHGKAPRFVVVINGECCTRVVPPDGRGGPGVVWVLYSYAHGGDWSDAVSRACVQAKESWDSSSDKGKS